MANLPKQYSWLLKLPELPFTIAEGLKLVGTVETPGASNNPVILGWAKEAGEEIDEIYKADSIPWCGLFAAVVVKRAKKSIVKSPLWALNWGTFGVHSPTPGLGDVLVFVRKTATGAQAGHVGFYVGETPTQYAVLGGNQNDSVNISLMPKNRLYTARRPKYNKQPAAVKPYAVSGAGLKVSTSEA